ncbi:MAG: hypothetical protein EHM41_19160 [Chloroflexi bacterium]|nr:MAG: hypothetical protein EHM41_19160 [Chloroflexota bacterium]
MFYNTCPEKHTGFSVETGLRLTIAIPPLLPRPVRLLRLDSGNVTGGSPIDYGKAFTIAQTCPPAAFGIVQRRREGLCYGDRPVLVRGDLPLLNRPP